MMSHLPAPGGRSEARPPRAPRDHALAPDALATLEQRIIATPSEALPVVLGDLERLRAIAWSRLVRTALTGDRPPDVEDDPLLTIPEVATQLHLAPSYVYDLARRGQLATVRAGKYVRIRRSTLRRWIAAHEEARLDRGLDARLTTGDERPRRAAPLGSARLAASRPRRGARRTPHLREPMGAEGRDDLGSQDAGGSPPRGGHPDD